MGVQVGETWEDRMECRQWGAHLPHVAGICGQSDYGAQSVALSGGYEDDEDHGEWFLYTGSGGRDLSGNKRTNKTQSFDQKFDKSNEALRVSCKKGYPLFVFFPFISIYKLKQTPLCFKQTPRSRTLTAVHDAMLEDVCHPAEIVGKRVRYRLDGSKIIKIYLDPKARNDTEYMLETLWSLQEAFW
ncbi:zinc finger (C3HC4-type RING finger) family protein [Artemisia annua]|uniref:Zinc finger (C3HC4-type RING finger) family protein n=1 Tax=Artemisia annua TaxID=35608 RepID=A0A2U1PQZ2_ARTAN|nr:zinc finger (C3HC4-type RING finger) family protein [Artemisia annua]